MSVRNFITRNYRAVMLAILTFGILGLVCPDQLVHSFGEGMFIAAFLALTVDEFVKYELASEISRDVWKKVFGHGVPAELTEEVNALMKTATIRRSVELDILLRDHPSRDDLFLCEARVEFCVENLTNEPQEFTHTIWVEKTPLPAGILPMWTAGASGCICGANDGYQLAVADLESEGKTGLHESAWQRKVTIPAKDPTTGKQRMARFWTETRQALPKRRNRDVFFSAQTLVGLTVKFTAPEGVHTNVVLKQRKEISKESPRRWRYDGTLFAGNGVMYEWDDRRGASANVS